MLVKLRFGTFKKFQTLVYLGFETFGKFRTLNKLRIIYFHPRHFYSYSVENHARKISSISGISLSLSLYASSILRL